MWFGLKMISSNKFTSSCSQTMFWCTEAKKLAWKHMTVFFAWYHDRQTSLVRFYVNTVSMAENENEKYGKKHLFSFETFNRIFGSIPDKYCK